MLKSHCLGEGGHFLVHACSLELSKVGLTVESAVVGQRGASASVGHGDGGRRLVDDSSIDRLGDASVGVDVWFDEVTGIQSVNSDGHALGLIDWVRSGVSRQVARVEILHPPVKIETGGVRNANSAAVDSGCSRDRSSEKGGDKGLHFQL